MAQALVPNSTLTCGNRVLWDVHWDESSKPGGQACAQLSTLLTDGWHPQILTHCRMFAKPDQVVNCACFMSLPKINFEEHF